MTTPDTRAIVSLAATMALTLALGACVSGPSRPVLDGPVTLRGRPLSIQFDNDARQHVHVYLVDGRQRQWLLGRIEPWSRATLSVPRAAVVGSMGFVQLAVLTGERVTLEVARDRRAAFTLAQPASAILSQRWMFTKGELMSLPVRGPRVGVDRE
jgi:hypothetical protein